MFLYDRFQLIYARVCAFVGASNLTKNICLVAFEKFTSLATWRAVVFSDVKLREISIRFTSFNDGYMSHWLEQDNSSNEINFINWISRRNREQHCLSP